MFQVFLMHQPQVQPWLQNLLRPIRSRDKVPTAGAAASLLGCVQLAQLKCVEGGKKQEK